MKRYEGLFILNLAGKEDGVKDVVDRVSAEITALGGKLEAIQKMDRKPFARIADKRHTAGHYVNVVFQAAPATVAQVRAKFRHSDEVFRILISEASRNATAAPAPISAA